MQFDPRSRSVEIRYPRGAKDAFYSEFMGTHQYLANGNLLITESMSGHILEVTPAGQIVWEYVNRYDEDETGLIEEAQRYDRGYFKVSDWSCAS